MKVFVLFQSVRNDFFIVHLAQKREINNNKKQINNNGHQFRMAICQIVTLNIVIGPEFPNWRIAGWNLTQEYRQRRSYFVFSDKVVTLF